ncbi:alkylphosphonate utilization protein [Cognatishimia sp. SS12]|uniref:alkylphosphonate utilization protein n=1 Tax=Cognatishimia sp. SS12 TaxID=2979465 RepID=UPI00232F848C|nr:alkylphosphonate utilization protein [Cognatishimia sp. SS12]MDC0738642.1 alkylphosphonate utilization protein [Cognatishimia sp. SS12]
MSCAICSAEAELLDFALAPRSDTLALCPTCHAGASGAVEEAPHWQCLHEAIWSTDAATQVLAYRLLQALPESPWARELLEIAYLEPETLAWAEAGMPLPSDVVHRDSNGAVLSAGDAVVLIKDLPVKGAGFTAKRGTAVRNISLVQDNDSQIEGRVEGQRIVILTKFVKKSG